MGESPLPPPHLSAIPGVLAGRRQREQGSQATVGGSPGKLEGLGGGLPPAEVPPGCQPRDTPTAFWPPEQQGNSFPWLQPLSLLSLVAAATSKSFKR